MWLWCLLTGVVAVHHPDHFELREVGRHPVELYDEPVGPVLRCQEGLAGVEATGGGEGLALGALELPAGTLAQAGVQLQVHGLQVEAVAEDEALAPAETEGTSFRRARPSQGEASVVGVTSRADPPRVLSLDEASWVL